MRLKKLIKKLIDRLQYTGNQLVNTNLINLSLEVEDREVYIKYDNGCMRPLLDCRCYTDDTDTKYIIDLKG